MVTGIGSSDRPFYPPNLTELKDLPCLFAYEQFDGNGSVGHLTSIRIQNEKIKIEYQLDQNFLKIPMGSEEIFRSFGCERWESSRTHWAVKDVDLFKTIFQLFSKKHYHEHRDYFLDTADMKRIWGDDYHGKTLVFLSHKATYKENVGQLGAALESDGIKSFIAHEDIFPSLEWQYEIIKALNTMDFFVALITDDFHTESWTDQEIGYALRRGVNYLCIKLESENPRGFLGARQALVIDWPNAPQRIIEHLQRLRAGQ